ncbi:Oidioi.mRNA.OKI2018_I69.chr2.g8427.t1.cds [Oikopleura dioica]|uniref:Oidioi.mRNA.OKI2018_I69.chr2.g8427.t1.cds n=1 Tax=Oikopleura dioica TaxID=34765 RepID=A0ABN7TA50_OIKDI|nr:Oidioi.mRNA.OKI2018_I69.chr2.g8427.t1.cds [Oikopleura dioica]
MSNEVSPESPPAYDSILKDGSGIPIAGEAVPQTQQQQEYAEYCAQQNTQQPVVVNQLPEGAVIVEQQPQVVVMQQVGPNYCHFCKQHVTFYYRSGWTPGAICCCIFFPLIGWAFLACSVSNNSGLHCPRCHLRQV